MGMAAHFFFFLQRLKVEKTQDEERDSKAVQAMGVENHTAGNV